MLEFFTRGGIMMYPLALTSIVAMVFIIERALALRKKKIIIPEIQSIVENFSSTKDIELATNVCNKFEGPLSNLIKLTLENEDLSKEELRQLLEDQGRQDIRHLNRGLSILETAAAIAPLMGLLGTVLGMIEVFAVIKEQGVGQTAALSGGISEALVSTVTGLFIGIPVLIAFNYFSQKSENIILDIENLANTLVQKLSRIKKAL